MPPPQIRTIAPYLPFADTLAHYVLREYRKPEALARLVILLPSRRAVRTVREALLRQSAGTPLLLPRLQPMGDVDEAELLLASPLLAEALSERVLDLPPAISPVRRVLLLARQVAALHHNRLGRSANMEQAVRLAQELVRLLDDVEREEVPFSRLSDIVPHELAEHWQVTLEFLQIVTHHWPQLLAAEEAEDPTKRRAMLLDLLREQWQHAPPPHPVIAAGSTGSIPAVARLLALIARLPQGQVILPGLDLEMPAETWELLEPSHPQHGLKQLLRELSCDRREVLPLVEAPPPSTAGVVERLRLMAHALGPAGASALPDMPDIAAALAGFSRIDCATEEEEARVIALLLRDALETAEHTAALVTPDRTLARRVAAIMRRFGITIDDSAGTALHHRPAAAFLRLLAQAAAGRLAPVPLLALLKHPLAACSMEPAACRASARALERLIWRGIRPAQGMAGIRAALAAHDSVPAPVLSLLAALETALQPFMMLMQQREAPFEALMAAHLHAAETLAATAEEPGVARLWAGEDGAQLSACLREIHHAAGATLEPVDPVMYPGMLDALLAGETFRPRYGAHPRLHILSPMEARLQHYDLTILGSMNEGTWPAANAADPWMSRPMREHFGLPPIERQVGQEAHSMMMQLGAPRCIITRAQKQGGAPTTPSRWLLRLDAWVERLGGTASFHAQGTLWRALAAQLIAADGGTPSAPPAPVPPVNVRPQRLSVTQVETLRRDPYSVYAAEILALRPLDALDEEPGPRHFGTLVHAAFEQFARATMHTLPDDPHALMLHCGREALARFDTHPSVQAFWWARFLRLARWGVEQEIARRPGISNLRAEEKIEAAWEGTRMPFSLRARLDRIEHHADGSITVVDYKTGTPPGATDIRLGYACQLPLEAALLRRAGQAAAVRELEYWHVQGSDEGGRIKKFSALRGVDLELLIEEADAGLAQLINDYADPAMPYLSCPLPHMAPRFAPYAHLARRAEWTVEETAEWD